MIEKLRQNLLAQLAIIYVRYLIGVTFIYASIIKIKGQRFTFESGADNPIDSSWHMFETLYASGLWWQLIGACQFVAGFLLASQRFSRLGMLFFLPIVANIFFMTISYPFAFTPVITAGLLLANLILIAWDWKALKPIVGLPINAEDAAFSPLEQQKIWTVIGVSMALYTTVHRFFFYRPFLWVSALLLIGLGGLVYWFVSYKKRVEPIV